jgi:heme exporter protein C
MRRDQTILAVITLGLLGYGFYQAIYVAPTEQTMGDIQRIFYYHVPCAWTAGVLFFVNFAASLVYLVRLSPGIAKVSGMIGNAVAAICVIATLLWRDPLYTWTVKFWLVFSIAVLYFLFWRLARNTSQGRADAWAVSAAEVGVVFCSIVLITGPLWAKPVWGIWWTWDVRLTTTLVCWMIYVSYLMMRKFSDSSQTATLAAALAVFGFLDVPIVYMSIRWWRTQHPAPVFASQGGSIDPQMRTAVMMNWMAFLCLAGLLTWMRYTLDRRRQHLDYLHTIEALNVGEDARMPTELKGIR